MLRACRRAPTYREAWALNCRSLCRLALAPAGAVGSPTTSLDRLDRDARDLAVRLGLFPASQNCGALDGVTVSRATTGQRASILQAGTVSHLRTW